MMKLLWSLGEWGVIKVDPTDWDCKICSALRLQLHLSCVSLMALPPPKCTVVCQRSAVAMPFHAIFQNFEFFLQELGHRHKSMHHPPMKHMTLHRPRRRSTQRLQRRLQARIHIFSCTERLLASHSFWGGVKSKILASDIFWQRAYHLWL